MTGSMDWACMAVMPPHWLYKSNETDFCSLTVSAHMGERGFKVTRSV